MSLFVKKVHDKLDLGGHIDFVILDESFEFTMSLKFFVGALLFSKIMHMQSHTIAIWIFLLTVRRMKENIELCLLLNVYYSIYKVNYW